MQRANSMCCHESSRTVIVPATAHNHRERRHREVLGVALVVVVLSCLLEVGSDQRVALGFLPDYPLPETCMSRRLFKIECPGCGLTRSFVHLAHGEWAASWNVHHVGWLLALVVVFQIPYRIFALATRHAPSQSASCARQSAPLGTSVPKFVGTLLVVLLIVNWIANAFVQ